MLISPKIQGVTAVHVCISWANFISRIFAFLRFSVCIPYPTKVSGASPCEPSFESRCQWMQWRPDAPTVLLESKDLSYNQKTKNVNFCQEKLGILT